MFPRKERTWKQYPQNVTAVNKQEALYLLHYITYVHITRSYLNLTEIIDLQGYRIIRKKSTISRLLARPQDRDSFIFPINKN